MTAVQRVVAPNPGPYTGPGTNTWILDAGSVAVVIDPGPDDEKHLAAINDRLGSTTVGVVLVTHSHDDHLPLAEQVAKPIHTPGHTGDHISFWLAEDRALFTGDLILGRGSSMVTYPEGDVAAYLRSLARLSELKPRMLFPGHWDPVTDAMAKIEEYRTHRLDREAQVLAEVKRGRGTAEELTRRVYGTELGGELMAAAEMTLRAHLKKLVDDGAVRLRTIKGREVYERSV